VRRRGITDLPSADPGTFDFFLDIGWLRGLDAGQQAAEGAGVAALANPGATLLMLAFGPTRVRSLLGGVRQEDVDRAFPRGDLIAVDPAQTKGLGCP
jgi:hypothetical protein